MRSGCRWRPGTPMRGDARFDETGTSGGTSTDARGALSSAAVHEARSPRRMAGRAVFVGVLLLAAIPLYFSLAPSWRPLVMRLACAVIVAGGCASVARRVRQAMEMDIVSPFEAPRPAQPPPELDSRFLRLRDEVVFSARSRPYFDAILWPQLCGLAGTELPRPPARKGLRRRGPPLATLEDLIARI